MQFCDRMLDARSGLFNVMAGTYKNVRKRLSAFEHRQQIRKAHGLPAADPVMAAVVRAVIVSMLEKHLPWRTAFAGRRLSVSTGQPSASDSAPAANATSPAPPAHPAAAVHPAAAAHNDDRLLDKVFCRIRKTLADR
jgi:hypothetical protein